MIVNQTTPYPISFLDQKGQALICRYQEEGRQYIFAPDIDITGLTASVQFVKPDNTFVIEAAEVVEQEEGPAYLVITIPVQATVVKGVGRYSVFIMDPDDEDFVLYSAEGTIWADDHLITDDMIESVAEVYGLRFPQDFLTVENLVDIVNYVRASLINDEVTGEDTTWSSQKIEQEIQGVTPDIEVSKDATGNPIEFNDGADAPLIRCVTQIAGYQEGTGTPSPDNIRPIVAYTSGYVMRRNYRRVKFDDDGVYSSIDGHFIPNGTNPQVYAYAIFDCLENQSKTILIANPGNDTAALYYNGDNFLSSESIGAQTQYNITTPTNCTKIIVESGGNATPRNTENVGNIEVVDCIYTTTYPDAIYRGREDCVNGEVECDFGMIDLSTATLTSLGNTPVWKISNTGAKPFPNSEKANIIAEAYDAIRLNGLSNYVGGISVRDNREIYINTGSDMDAPQGYAAYELATPTTSPVTVSNLPIRTLSGYNHIESSTGAITLEYLTQTYDPIAELIDRSALHVYSTDEKVVGKWVDGKDLYEKTFVLPAEITLTPNTWNNITGVSLPGVDTPIRCEIRSSRGTINPKADFFDDPVTVWADAGTNKVLSLTFWYTKA